MVSMDLVLCIHCISGQQEAGDPLEQPIYPDEIVYV